MDTAILAQNTNISGLLDQWLNAEHCGTQYPVPFDIAWQIAGYSKKANAKRDGLKGLKKDKHYAICSKKSKTPLGGRSSELITLSIEAFKHLCLMAATDEGEAIRDYFIDAEKKWKLTQQVAPQVASEVEMLHQQMEYVRLQIEMERAKESRLNAEVRIAQFRDGLIKSTSIEYAAIITGEKPILSLAPAPVVEQVFVTEDGQQVGKTAKGATVNSLATSLGVNLKGKGANSRKEQIKAVLKSMGINLETGDGCAIASYMGQHYVVPQERVAEVKARLIKTLGETDPNIYASMLGLF